MDLIKKSFIKFIIFLKNLKTSYYNIIYARRFFKRFKKADFRSWDMVDTLFILSFETFCEFYEQQDFKNDDWDSTVELRQIKNQIDGLYNWYLYGIKDKWSRYFSRLDFYCKKYGVKREEIFDKLSYTIIEGPSEEIVKDLIKEKEELIKEEEDKISLLIKLRHFLNLS